MDHWLGILAESGKAIPQYATGRDLRHASNPPLKPGPVYTIGKTKLPVYERVRAYPGLSLDLLIAQNIEHQDCSPDDALKTVEPQQHDGDLSGPLPSARHVQVLPPR